MDQSQVLRPLHHYADIITSPFHHFTRCSTLVASCRSPDLRRSRRTAGPTAAAAMSTSSRTSTSATTAPTAAPGSTLANRGRTKGEKTQNPFFLSSPPAVFAWRLTPGFQHVRAVPAELGERPVRHAPPRRANVRRTRWSPPPTASLKPKHVPAPTTAATTATTTATHSGPPGTPLSCWGPPWSPSHQLGAPHSPTSTRPAVRPHLPV